MSKAARRQGGKAAGRQGGSNGGWALAAAALLLLAAFPPSRLAAQTDPRLVSAVRLAQEGQGDSARAITRKLLTETAASDTLYPQMLYTAALVAPTTADMQRALQRVVIEYSSSDWVDDALLKLAQLDYAGGNARGAAEKLDRIRTDFPSSSIMPAAALWAARAYFELGNNAAACRWLGDGVAKAGADVELANQLAYYQQRCAALAAAPAADTVKRDSAAATARAPTTPARPAPTLPPAATPPASSKPAPARAAAFRVQIAAVKTAEQAAPVLARLKAHGFAADTVHEGGYVKVRVGRYATREQAQAALAQVKKKDGGQPFVVHEP